MQNNQTKYMYMKLEDISPNVMIIMKECLSHTELFEYNKSYSIRSVGNFISKYRSTEMRKVCEFEIHIHVLEIAFIDSAYCSASRSEGEEKELCQVIFFWGGGGEGGLKGVRIYA